MRMVLRGIRKKLRVVRAGKSILLYIPKGDNKDIVSKNFVIVKIGDVIFASRVYRYGKWNVGTLNIPSYARKKLEIEKKIGETIDAEVYIVSSPSSEGDR